MAQTKTGFGFLIGMTIWLAAMAAQADIVCRAQVDRRTVPVGGEVVLTVSVEGDVAFSSEFKLPALAGVNVFGGSTNHSMSFVGNRSQTTISRTYYLNVVGEDDFTIGPIRVVSAGTECQTDPIDIKVVASGTPNIPPATTGNRVQQPGGHRAPASSAQPSPKGGRPGDDVFVTLSVDHSEAWIGQQVILTFRYFRRIQAWNNPQYKAPRTEGFWREDLGSERDYHQVISGRNYNVTEIRYALFPTRPGTLRIEPAELTFREDAFARFFNNTRRQGPRRLKTEAVTVQVKELPRPVPAEFSGLVATKTRFQADVDRQSVLRGEPISLKISLTSDGFLKGFEGLVVPEPENVRMHDAGEGFATDPNPENLLSQITVEKVLVPAVEGILHIPAATLSWFDANTGHYRTATAGVKPIEVKPSDLPAVGDDASGFLRTDITRRGQDLAFIHSTTGHLSRRAGPWLGTPLWWILLSLPLAMLAAWRLYLARLSAARRDPAGLRRRKALVVAKRSLTEADRQSDLTARLSALSRSVSGFVADCTNRPRASIGAPEVRAFCLEHDRTEIGQRLHSILVDCDGARYGGSTLQDAQVKALRDEILASLSDLHVAQQPQPPKRKHRTAPAIVLVALALGTGSQTQANDTAVSDATVAAAAVTSPGIDPARLLAEGNQAYTEGNLDLAMVRYEAARDLGTNDAVLHYNLGNTHARRGELGLAIVSYLRAQRLDPRDRDIRNNLAYVSSHCKDLELAGGDLPPVVAQMTAFVRTFTLDEWGIVLLVLIWTLAPLVAWAWYRQEFTDTVRRTLLVGAGVLLLVAVIISLRWYGHEVRSQAVVIATEASVHSGPADDFQVLFEVHDGLIVNIEGERDGWARIGMGGDWQGWVPTTSLVRVRQ